MSEEFVIKDSGQREQFDGGMVRDTQNGKLRYDLALDGPVVWATIGRLYPQYQELLWAAQAWYERGGVDAAAVICQHLVELEKDLIDRYASHLMKGAIKYSERNWMKASGENELRRFKSSFCRHLLQYVRGDGDEDHAAAVVFNVNGTEYVREKLQCEPNAGKALSSSVRES